MIRIRMPMHWSGKQINTLDEWLTETFLSGWEWSHTDDHPIPYSILCMHNEEDALLVKLMFEVL